MSYYTKDDICFEQAKEWILQNYFDGDEDVKAITTGDEEHMVMVKAVEALDSVIANINAFSK